MPVPAIGGGGGAASPPLGSTCGAGCSKFGAGARNVVYPEPREYPGRATGAGVCLVTTFPIMSVAVTVTFASSDGALAQPNTVQPPFSAKQSE